MNEPDADVADRAAMQLKANRPSALLSTGPRTEAGKARSAANGLEHGLNSRIPVAITRGPFAEDATEVQMNLDASPIGAVI